MVNFITNSKSNNLKKRLIELISKSEELKFLIGFFYFSGIKSLSHTTLISDGVVEILFGPPPITKMPDIFQN